MALFFIIRNQFITSNFYETRGLESWLPKKLPKFVNLKESLQKQIIQVQII